MSPWYHSQISHDGMFISPVPQKKIRWIWVLAHVYSNNYVSLDPISSYFFLFDSPPQFFFPLPYKSSKIRILSRLYSEVFSETNKKGKKGLSKK